MNEDVRMPIEVSREGDKITKVCVEDVYKIITRIYEALDSAYNKSSEILESVKKEYYPANEPGFCYEGYLIKGTGVSKPCNDDVFNEDTGNNIAFMKAKLNANIKKHNILCRVWNTLAKAQDKIDEDLMKIDKYIKSDLDCLRDYNNEYLVGLEEKLGIE